jgi:antitoxin component HigA of HigAB toxin-antitoxin module
MSFLTGLVEDYEDGSVTIPDAAGADVLRELLRVNDLSQAKLAKDVGIMQSTLSELVNGRRRFTTDQWSHLASSSVFHRQCSCPNKKPRTLMSTAHRGRKGREFFRDF